MAVAQPRDARDWSDLTGRLQRVVIEGSNSSWKDVKAGVPQGSVLGPLLFLIYINDIQLDINCDCFLFADDTMLLEEVSTPEIAASTLNKDLNAISLWSEKWLVTMNTSKTKSMVFSLKRNKPDHPTLKLSDKVIDEVSSHEHLGVLLSSNMSWKAHIEKIYQNASKSLNLLKGFKFKLSRSTLEILYKSFVRSKMEYADVIWDGCTMGESDLLESVQYDAAKLISGAMKGTHRESLLNDCGLQKLSNRRKMHKLILLYKMVKGLAPIYLLDLCPFFVGQRTSYSLRTRNDLCLPFIRTEKFKNSFLYSATNLWNSLSESSRESVSIASFKSYLLRERFFILPVNKLVYLGDRYLSILHTRLRLKNCGLNYYLFLMNCIPSPSCACGAPKEDVTHYLMFCPGFAALRATLLTSVMHHAGVMWTFLNLSQQVDILLHGSRNLIFDVNASIFYEVRLYISHSARFS